MNTLKTKTLKTLAIFAILIIISIALILTLPRAHAQAEEYFASPLNQVSTLNSSKDDDYVKMSDIDANDLSDVKYISNCAYFMNNPQHADQNDSYNVAGTCTTVAMQMLLGYHNYYSDRRLIPKFGDNNRQFLDDDYGNVSDNPIIPSNSGHSFISLGTKVDLYDELYDLTVGGSFPALGQAIGPVASAAEEFVEKYSNISSDNVTIVPSDFFDKWAKTEINENRPVILGKSLILNGADNYHVMVAYGYATVNGEPGYIVHYSWEEDTACVWVPTKYFKYQIRMEVEHTHNLIDAGINIQGRFDYRSISYRKLECTECGYTTVDDLYETDEYGCTITAVRYPVSGELQIPSKIRNNTPQAIGERVFAGSNITSLKLQDNISSIGDRAFENCNGLTIVSNPPHMSSFASVTSIGKYAFRGCNLNIDIDIPRTLTYIGEGAFAGCDEANISVAEYNPNYYAQDNILYNKSKTAILQALRIPNKITIPDSITEVAPYAFEGNSNIDTVYIIGSPKIGNNAFANCANLGTVYFDSYTAPIVGTDVFKNKVPTIIAPYNAQRDFKTAFSQYAYNVTSQQFAVDFVSNGKVMEARSVYNGSTIDNLPTPTLTGYDFGGWYDNPSCKGTPYTNGGLWESDTTITLYAKWTPQDCTIIFDGNGGLIPGDNFMIVKFGSTFTTKITAEKEGNVLDGWYDSNNVKYITADGRITKPWDKTGINTLKAKWSPKSYEIRINNNGTITWLSNDGLSESKCYLQYGSTLNAINLIAIFKKSAQGFKEGKIFDHFEYENKKLDWTTVPDLGENNSVITIIPIWIDEVHTIHFHTLCDIVVSSITKDYGSSITLPSPTRTGYTFGGWYKTETGGTKITWATMPDLTPTDQNNGSIQLYAHWTPITYNLYYNTNGGSGAMNYTTHTYGVAFNLPANKFTKTGYNFVGWATSASGNVVYTDGQKVQDLANKQGASITLYAKWDAKTYTITYKNLATNMFVGSGETYKYGVGLQKLPIPQINISFTSRPYLERFYGWYKSIDFKSKVDNISTTDIGNITLYAKYDYTLSSPSSIGTSTVTDGGTSSNNEIIASLTLSVIYERIKNTTLKKIRVEFSLDLWEVDDGYQHIYVVNKNGTPNKDYNMWSTKIDHSGGKKTYSFSFELDLETY